jgi:hypothetical protein
MIAMSWWKKWERSDVLGQDSLPDDLDVYSAMRIFAKFDRWVSYGYSGVQTTVKLAAKRTQGSLIRLK